ncbi:DoxX family membrane protein, partial [archaeon]|nr:DoxX family membrane protein [archaeon]
KDFIGYLPVFLLNYVSAGNLIMFNGLFELIFGTMLILGFFTRVTAFILAGHLFSIMLSLGYNDVAVRDFGLSLATFSILLRGSDKWCLDQKIR